MGPDIARVVVEAVDRVMLKNRPRQQTVVEVESQFWAEFRRQTPRIRLLRQVALPALMRLFSWVEGLSLTAE